MKTDASVYAGHGTIVCTRLSPFIFTEHPFRGEGRGRGLQPATPDKYLYVHGGTARRMQPRVNV